jgi:hypothetical protein
LPQAHGCLDIPGVGMVAATGQENHQFTPAHSILHPIARPVIDPQLQNAFTHRLW